MSRKAQEWLLPYLFVRIFLNVFTGGAWVALGHVKNYDFFHHGHISHISLFIYDADLLRQ